MKTSERIKMLSHFVYQIGGWNATAGIHTGRLVAEPDFEDNEKIVRLLLKSHEFSVTYPLREEVKKLKAEIYDLKERLQASKDKPISGASDIDRTQET